MVSVCSRRLVLMDVSLALALAPAFLCNVCDL
jgi:hypothetical protein